MDPLASGLRFRLRRAVRRMAEQHRHMQEVARAVEGALTEPGDGLLAEALGRYRQALEAHFALEDEVFFPALHGLYPEEVGELESLSREHADFRAALARLDPARAASLGDDFRALTATLREHEAREERIARRLADAAPDAQDGPASPPSRSGVESSS
jgi:hypothetical protein